MQTVKLIPKSTKGTRDFIQAGSPEHWTVVRTADMVAFSDRNGPWLFCTPNTPDSKTHARWVHATDDNFFNVEVIR